MDLRCTTNNCEFHFKDCCTAAIIDVSEKGVCHTKIKRPGGAYAQTLEEFEMAEELAPLSDHSTIVQCDALKCVHNKDTQCRADHILVGDAVFRTRCFTLRRSRGHN